MHCYVKQIIQTLRVNDHRCALLTNQQADEAGCWSWLPDLETTRLENFSRKRKVIVQMQKKQTNVQIVYILKENDAFHPLI